MIEKILLVTDNFDPISNYKLFLVKEALKIVDISTVIFLNEKYKQGDEIFQKDERIALLGACIPQTLSPKYLINGESFENEGMTVYEKIQLQKNRYPNSTIYLLIDSKEYEYLKQEKDFLYVLSISKLIIYLMPEDEEILNDNFLKSREVLFIGNTKELEELSKASVLNVNKNLFNPLIIEFMNVSEEVAIKRIKNHLSNNRFKHSLRVAGTIKQIHEIAEINDAELCYDSYLAALYHDICKEMNINEQIKISKEKLGLESYESSKILHGPVGAWYIKEKYLLNKEDILEAISQHTVPSENPKMITMLLFLADHLEIEKKRRYPENLYQEVWNLISQKEIYAAFTKVKNYCDEKIKLKQLEKQPEFKDIK